MSKPKDALPGSDASEGMSYLSTLPQRLVTLYLPLSLIVLVLLFPFYWMVVTAVKPKQHLLDLDAYNPFWTLSPTLEHINDLLFKTDYPLWLWNTMFIAVSATILSLIASVFAAYAIVRIRYRGAQTAGGLIFIGDLGRSFKAVDVADGEVLWETKLGTSVQGFPISFAVDGKQYVAVPTAYGAGAPQFYTEWIVEEGVQLPQSGSALYVFALPERRNDRRGRGARAVDAGGN